MGTEEVLNYIIIIIILLRNRMAERFASVSEDELCRIIEEKYSKNTK